MIMQLAGSYLHSLAVGPDVSRRPMRHTLHMQRVSVLEASLCRSHRPVMKQYIHLQELTHRQPSLNTHPAEGERTRINRQIGWLDEQIDTLLTEK